MLFFFGMLALAALQIGAAWAFKHFKGRWPVKFEF
jgi:hypothetical protein